MVRPKKSLGQHFLKDLSVAHRIVEALELPADKKYAVLEIGPGMGVLTKMLIERKEIDLYLVEIDRDSVAYLKKEYPFLISRISEADFLQENIASVLPKEGSIIGNFPYNISSQIFFKVLENRDYVDQIVCMLQKEVADRIASKHGNKTYGILSVFLQAFYSIEYLFKVPPGVFHPPPKVMSAVIRLKRNERRKLGCDETLFYKVVKESFQKRRKTLRNGLKHLNLPRSIVTMEMMDKRPEQLSVEDFIFLTRLIEEGERVQ